MYLQNVGADYGSNSMKGSHFVFGSKFGSDIWCFVTLYSSTIYISMQKQARITYNNFIWGGDEWYAVLIIIEKKIIIRLLH